MSSAETAELDWRKSGRSNSQGNCVEVAVKILEKPIYK